MQAPFGKEIASTLEQLKQAGRIAAIHPPACPSSLFAIQGQIVTANDPDQVIFCDTQETLLTMVETGYAFAVMAVFPQLRRPGLRYLPLKEFSPLSYGAVWPSGGRNQALRTFLHLLEDTLHLPEPENA